MRNVGRTKPHIYPLSPWGIAHYTHGARIYTPDGFYYGAGLSAKEAYDSLVRKLKAKGLYWEVFP